jgi:hypothetical protein
MQELRKRLVGPDIRRMIPAPNPTNRAAIQEEIFGRAEVVTREQVGRSSQLKETVREIGQYVLVEGRTTGCCYDPNVGLSISMSEWMGTMRNGSIPAGSFYFPDNHAGPDILFALEHKNRTMRKDAILCVVQVSVPLVSLSEASLNIGTCS